MRAPQPREVVVQVPGLAALGDVIDGHVRDVCEAQPDRWPEERIRDKRRTLAAAMELLKATGRARVRFRNTHLVLVLAPEAREGASA